MSYCVRGNYDDHVTTTEAHQLLPNTVAIDMTRAEKTDARDHLCCDPRRAVYRRARGPATKVLVEATQPLPPLPLETNSGATANRNGKIEEVLDKVHSRLLLSRRTRSPMTSEQRKDAAPEQIVGRLSLEPQVTAARWRHEAVVAQESKMAEKFYIPHRF